MNLDDKPLNGEAEPPLINGELDFAEPWQGRVFASAVALADRGVFAWSEFQAALIAEIGRWEKSASDDPYAYYDRFQSALETLLAAKGVLPGNRVEQRAAEYAARPHGHDHH